VEFTVHKHRMLKLLILFVCIAQSGLSHLVLLLLLHTSSQYKTIDLT